MRDLAAERDPGRNANFSRPWADDPLQLPDLQHLRREVAPRVVEDVARRAIGRWLDKASGTLGAPAAEAFREADSIRLKMGLAWGDLIEDRSAEALAYGFGVPPEPALTEVRSVWWHQAALGLRLPAERRVVLLAGGRT